MEYFEFLSKHDQIQVLILKTCRELNIEARKEYRGKDWRADVFIPNNNQPIAFEIQISSQSLNRTLQRQAKYTRDNIVGCWFFENPIPKLNKERPDLPLFYVESNGDYNFLVNLGDRRKIELKEFLLNFILNKIQFRKAAITKAKQTVGIVFYEFPCWKCSCLNYLYYVDTPFLSACNAKIRPQEALWESNSIEYHPEIINFVQVSLEKQGLKIGAIKPRHSQTVGKSYVSFGCYNCDSIFGDYYVFEAKIDVMYDPNKIVHSMEIDLKNMYSIPTLGHWCYPEDGKFCNEI